MQNGGFKNNFIFVKFKVNLEKIFFIGLKKNSDSHLKILTLFIQFEL